MTHREVIFRLPDMSSPEGGGVPAIPRLAMTRDPLDSSFLIPTGIGHLRDPLLPDLPSGEGTEQGSRLILLLADDDIARGKNNYLSLPSTNFIGN